MNLFSGVHEVRVLGRNRVLTGYFDDWDAALKAVGVEPDYKAAYFTLNPIVVPADTQINPVSLSTGGASASNADVKRRVTLLIDLDPPRPSGTSSTDEEKRAAFEQAQRVKEWLTAQGWPAPTVADSGNGWHL